MLNNQVEDLVNGKIKTNKYTKIINPKLNKEKNIHYKNTNKSLEEIIDIYSYLYDS
jgi:hypothetical protein